ncbi:MAG: class II aldolase/adducin family protein, partial [Bacteroidota bacterium]
MQSKLRQDVLAANREIFKRGLAKFTFGNVSAVDRKLGHIVIKPSGVPYEAMNAEAMVVTDLNGKVVE